MIVRGSGPGSGRCGPRRRWALVAGACAALLAASGCAYIERSNVSSSENQDRRPSNAATLGGDGRFVVFHSFDGTLLGSTSADSNSAMDVFLRDHAAGTTSRVSVSSTGGQPNGLSIEPTVTDDGRFVTFWSQATNLVPGDTNGRWDLYLRDRQSGTNERISVDGAGNQSVGVLTSGTNRQAAITPDGRYVAFASPAGDLVAGDTDNQWDVFVRDRVAGTTEIASVSSIEVHGVCFAAGPSISDDGRFVAFHSCDAWGPGDTNGVSDVYVRDRGLGTTDRASVDSLSSLQSNGTSTNASISANGRYVAFQSTSTNLYAGHSDTNNASDVFVHDRASGTTERVSSRTYSTAQANGASTTASVSDDGRIVGFLSGATDLVVGDTNAVVDYFVRDRVSQRTLRVSANQAGDQSAAAATAVVDHSLTGDGRYVVFNTTEQLVAADTNTASDTHLRFTLEPGPLAGGGVVARGTQASFVVTGGAFAALDTTVIVVPGDDVTVDSVVAAFPALDSVTVTLTVAPGAAPGPRHLIAANPGNWSLASGAAALCSNCLTIS